MKPIDLPTLAAFCGGTLQPGATGNVQVTHVSTDSRTIKPGDVFVALAGDKFDAHNYLDQVAQAGAAAVVVSKLPSASLRCAVVLVPDTLKGLQSLAHAYRLWHNPFVLGITGSNGKTSTKDLTISVLSCKDQVCGTFGNLNNHIGMPLSILRMAGGDTCGVFEMGMNHPDEIAPLAAIAKPDAAIITNVGIAHIEYMGTRAAIAQEKGMLAEAIDSNGFVVLNANDDQTTGIAARCTARVIRAGIGSGDVSVSNLKASVSGTAFTIDFGGERHDAFLPISGEHMVSNAALAAAAGWQRGIAPAQIVDALRQAKFTKGRLENKVVNDILFLDDSYNANPDSMKAGLRTLAGLDAKGDRVAVLGRMGELGEHAVAEHQQIGEYAASLGLNALFTVGHEANLITEAAHRHAPELSTKHFSNHADCAAYLREFLHAGDVVLLKGSRSSAMEQILVHFQSS